MVHKDRCPAPVGVHRFPIDLNPDGLLFFGQIDDLIFVRFSDPVVLEECREQSRAFLSERGKHYMMFAVAFPALRIFLLIFLAVYLFKKMRRYSTL